ncbi:MAG: glycosyltransferase [Pseudomonadota bacterium]
MPSPRFSLAVPIGAHHWHLKTTLASIAAQGPLVDIAFLDASNDPRVKTAAEPYADLISYRRTGPDDGQADAIAEGWRNTDGDIVGWLNVDDALYPGALSAAAKIFNAHPDIDVVYGQSAILDEEGGYLGLHPAVAPPSDLIRRSCIVSQPSCFVRRRALEAAGGLQTHRHYTMDWDLWVRLYDNGARFHYVDDVLSTVIWDLSTKTAKLNGARLREIYGVAARSGSQTAALKSAIGFSLHHLTTYSAAAPLARAAVRILRGADGPHRPGDAAALQGPLTFPLVHYGPEPKAGVAIEGESLHEAEAILTVGGDALGPIETSPQRLSLRPDAPIAPAEPVMLSLTPAAGRQTRFSRARWIEN